MVIDTRASDAKRPAGHQIVVQQCRTIVLVDLDVEITSNIGVDVKFKIELAHIAVAVNINTTGDPRIGKHRGKVLILAALFHQHVAKTGIIGWAPGLNHRASGSVDQIEPEFGRAVTE